MPPPHSPTGKRPCTLIRVHGHDSAFQIRTWLAFPTAANPSSLGITHCQRGLAADKACGPSPRGQHHHSALRDWERPRRGGDVQQSLW